MKIDSRKILALFTALFCSILLFSKVALAADDPAPLAMMKSISTQALASIRSGTPVRSVVDQHLLPHVALAQVSKYVVGRNNWNQASNAQRQQFEKLFVGYLTRTYESALIAYKDQNVQFYPVGNVAGKSRVVVRTSVAKGGHTTAIDYNLIQLAGNWKVYDITVEGVSMRNSYRSQFADILANQGMEGLISELKRRQ